MSTRQPARTRVPGKKSRRTSRPARKFRSASKKKSKQPASEKRDANGAPQTKSLPDAEKKPAQEEKTNVAVEVEPGELDAPMRTGEFDWDELIRPHYATWSELTVYLFSKRHSDEEYREAFLFTYLDFGSPEQLIKDLVHELHAAPKRTAQAQIIGSSAENGSVSVIPPTLEDSTAFLDRKKFLVQFVQHWMWDFPKDFTEGSMALFRGLSADLPPLEWLHDLHEDVHDGLQAVFANLRVSCDTAVERAQKETSKLRGKSRRASTPSMSFLKKFTDRGNVPSNMTALKPDAVAAQLTLLQAERYSDIVPREFVDLQHLQGNTTTTHWSAAPTVLSYVNYHNQVSWWIKSIILSSPRASTRASSVSWAIEVAHNCLSHGNFETTFSIVGGLLWHEVYRLKDVWALLKAKARRMWDDLQEITSPAQNYKAYREAFTKLQDSNKARIPFVGLILGAIKGLRPRNDPVMELISRNRSSKLPLINFSRRMAIYEIARKVVLTQKSTFDIEEDHNLQMKLVEGIVICEPYTGGQLYLAYEDSTLLTTIRPETGVWMQFVHYLICYGHRDTEFRDAFLLNLHDLASPEQLLDSIINDIRAGPEDGTTQRKLTEGERTARFVRISMEFREHLHAALQLIQHWLWDYPRDFTDEMMKRIMETTKQLPLPEWRERLTEDVAEHIAVHVQNMIPSVETAQKRAAVEEKKIQELIRTAQPASNQALKRVISLEVTDEILEYDAKCIAEQLTLMQLELFLSVPARELTQTRWMRKDKWVQAPSVLSYIAHHNKLSLWVIHEIVSKNITMVRLSVVEKFIDVGMECLALGNFDSLFSIVGALSATPVYRLKYTWQGLDKKYSKRRQTLLDITSTLHNHSNYRQALSEFVAKEEPHIPFLGIILSDLVRVDSFNRKKAESRSSISASSDKSGMSASSSLASLASLTDSISATTCEPVLDFRRYMQVYRLIQQLAKSQRSTFPCSADFQLQILLRENIMKAEPEDANTLYKLSLDVEPKNIAKKQFEEMIYILEDAGF